MLVRSQDFGVSWGAPVSVASGYRAKVRLSENGTWQIAYYTSSGSVFVVRSTDSGDTWSTPLELFQNVRYEIGLATDDAGNWVAAVMDGVSVTERYIRVSRSTDDGVTWSSPTAAAQVVDAFATARLLDLAASPDGVFEVIWRDAPSSIVAYSLRSTDSGATWGIPARMYTGDYPDGASSYPYEYWKIASGGGDNWFVLANSVYGWVVSASRDRGYSWGDAHTRDVVYSTNWADLAADDNGNVLVAKPDAGQLYLGRSADGGKTWMPVEQMALPASGSHLTVAMDDAGHWMSVWADNDAIRFTRSLPEVDTDGDGLSDLAETNTGTYVSDWSTGTDPNKADTDGDGVNDGDELAAGTYPLGATWPDMHDPVVPGQVYMSQVGPESCFGSSVSWRPALAGDGTGRWLVLWNTFGTDVSIYSATTLDNGETWQSPVQLFSGTYPVLAVSESGVWLMVFRAINGTALQVCRSTDGGATWSTPQIVVSADSSLRPEQLVWCGGADWVLGYTRDSVFYTVHTPDNGLTWTNPVVASDGYIPKLTVDHAGAVSIVSSDISGTDMFLVLQQSVDFGATWSVLPAPSDMTTSTAGVGVVTDATASVLVANHNGAQVGAVRLPNGGSDWSEPVQLLPDAAFSVDAATNGAGNIVGVWTSQVRQRIMISRSWDHGQSWSQPVMLAPYGPGTGGMAPVPYVVMDAAGGVMVAWRNINNQICISHADLSKDSDGDGLADWFETGTGAYVSGQSAGSDPYNSDTDGDGLPDAWEANNGLNPNDDGSVDRQQGPNGDPDHDGFSNREEYLAGTNPTNQQSSPLTDGGPGVPIAGNVAVGVLLAGLSLYGGTRLVVYRCKC